MSLGEDPEDASYPPRLCRTCEKWKPHRVFEVEGRGKDKGRTLVKADCFSCRDAWRTKLLERVKAAAERRNSPEPMHLAGCDGPDEQHGRCAEGCPVLGQRGPNPKPKRKGPRQPSSDPKYRYTYLGKLPELLHLVMQTGFYLGRAIASKNKMRRKFAFVSYYKYRAQMIAALEAARARAASQQAAQSVPQERREEEWEQMRREVEALAGKLGQG